MEHKKRITNKRDLQSIKTAIASLAHDLWLEKRHTFNPGELEWLVDGRLKGQLDELSKLQLLRVQRLLERTVTRTGRRYMTGSPI
jgi:hypothetical protein